MTDFMRQNHQQNLHILMPVSSRQHQFDEGLQCSISTTFMVCATLNTVQSLRVIGHLEI